MVHKFVLILYTSLFICCSPVPQLEGDGGDGYHCWKCALVISGFWVYVAYIFEVDNP